MPYILCPFLVPTSKPSIFRCWIHAAITRCSCTVHVQRTNRQFNPIITLLKQRASALNLILIRCHASCYPASHRFILNRTYKYDRSGRIEEREGYCKLDTQTGIIVIGDQVGRHVLDKLTKEVGSVDGDCCF